MKTNQLSLKSLVLDFKQKSQGESGIIKPQRLLALAATSIAYAAPLPNNGRFGSGEAYNQTASKVVSSFLSDVNECLYMDVDRAVELAKALYLNRYEMVYCTATAMEALSPKEILVGIFDGDEHVSGVDAAGTMVLWGERFAEAADQYVKQCQSEE